MKNVQDYPSKGKKEKYIITFEFEGKARKETINNIHLCETDCIYKGLFIYETAYLSHVVNNIISIEKI